MYNEQSLIENRLKSLWTNKVKQTSNYTSLKYLSEKDNFNNSDFMLSKSARDHFKQKWYSFNNSSKLEYYCMYKEQFEFELYLNDLNKESFRTALRQFRLS